MDALGTRPSALVASTPCPEPVQHQCSPSPGKLEALPGFSCKVPPGVYVSGTKMQSSPAPNWAGKKRKTTSWGKGRKLLSEEKLIFIKESRGAPRGAWWRQKGVSVVEPDVGRSKRRRSLKGPRGSSPPPLLDCCRGSCSFSVCSKEGGGLELLSA